MDPDQSDVFHVQIKDRLAKTKLDVKATLDLMLRYQKELQLKQAAAGRKPRVNERALKEQIKAIEFDMMTNNMSKKEEDSSLRRITQIRAEIKLLDEFKDIDALKYRVKVTQERLDLQRKAVKELTSGLRKLEVIRKIFRTTGEQIPLKEVLEKDLALQDSVIGDFIGFRGQNIRKLEADHSVVLDYEARYKVVHICGSAAGVAAAEAAIAEINTYVSKTVSVAIVASRLIFRGSPLKEQLEQAHGVRLDVPAAPRTGSSAGSKPQTYDISIRGPPHSVAATEADIEAFLRDSDEVDIPGRLTSVIIGPKGATIDELQDTHQVRLVVDRAEGGRRRRDGTVSKCWIFGQAANRAAALVAVKELIEQREEVEEQVPLDKKIVPFFIGPSGSRIQKFGEDTEAHAKVNDEVDFVTLRGTRAAIARGKEELAKIVDQYHREYVVREFAKIEFNLVAGDRESGKLNKLKKETGLRMIRGSAPYATNPGKITMAGSEESIAAAQAIIDKVLADVTSVELNVHKAQRRFIIGQKGSAIMKIEKESGAFLTVGGDDNTTVRIVGSDEAVAVAKGLVEAICKEHFIRDVEVPSSYVGELIGPKGAGINALRKEHSVNIDVPKASRNAEREGVAVTLEGPEEGVLAAEQAIVGAVERYARCNKEFRLHPIFARQVGQNSQATLKSLEAEGVTGAQIINLGYRRRARREGGASPAGSAPNGGLLLRVSDPDHMAKLEEAIVARNGAFALRSTPDSPSAEIEVAKGYMGVVIGKGGAEISRVQSEFGVAIDVDKAKSIATVVGESEDAVAGAREDISTRLRRMVRLEVTVDARRLQLEKVLGRNLEGGLRRLQAQYGGPREVFIKVEDSTTNKKNVKVRIEGTAVATQAVQKIIENAAKGRVTLVLELVSAEHAESLQEHSLSHIEKVRADCRVAIEIYSEGGEAHVSVAGPPESAAKAEQSIYNLLRFSFPAQYLRVAVPPTLVQEIRRSRFAPINAIQEECDVKIQVRDTHVYVRGTSVAESEGALKRLIKEHGDRMVVMPVAADMFGSIIGAKGATIRRIVKDAGGDDAVQIDINRDKASVTIRGQTQEATRLAQEGIQAVIDAELARVIAFDVPDYATGEVIGKGGQTIRRIQEETGCRIFLRRETGRCEITGPERENMEQAEAMIKEILEKSQAEEEEREATRTLRDTRDGRSFTPSGPHIELEVKTRWQPAVIGRRGATISKIQDDTGCRINLLKDAGLCYIVGGSEEGRLSAKAQIEEIINDRRKEEAERAAAREAEAAAAAGEADSAEAGDAEAGGDAGPKRRAIVGLGAVSTNNSRRAKRRANKKARSRQEAVERALNEVRVQSVATLAQKAAEDSAAGGTADQETLDMLLSLGLDGEEPLPNPDDIGYGDSSPALPFGLNF